MSALGNDWSNLLSDLELGFELLRELPPAVTFFGGARIRESDPFYEQSKELGGLLRRARIPPRTGAGPGIMTSVPEGYKAFAQDRRCQTGAYAQGLLEAYDVGEPAPATQGIKIFLPFEPETNEAIDRSVELVTFPIRRLMLYENSLALVVFPGGIGTLDELFEVWARRNAGLHQDPIVLYGSAFFRPIVNALRAVLIDGPRNLIDAGQFDAVTISDDPQAIVDDLVDADGLVGFDEAPELLARRLLEEIPFVAGALRMAPTAVTVLGGDALSDEDPAITIVRSLLAQLAETSVVRVGASGTLAHVALAIYQAQGRVAELQGFFLRRGLETLDPGWRETTCLEVTDPLAHKLLLTENSSGFLVLPGGMQTLDEVFSVLCEMQTGKRPEAPIVLIDSGFWRPVVEACEQVMLSPERQTVSPDDFARLTVVDTAKDALDALKGNLDAD